MLLFFFLSQYSPKDLDLSNKIDVDLRDFFGRKKNVLMLKEIQYWVDVI